MKSILIFICWKFIHCTFISEWDKYWWRRWDWLCWHTFPPQVDSWETKCCLFIDSPIYPHLRQLIMATPVILKIRITDSHLVCDSCSLTSDLLLVEMGIILVQFDLIFFPWLFSSLEGYNACIGALWRVNAKEMFEYFPVQITHWTLWQWHFSEVCVFFEGWLLLKSPWIN